MRYVPEIIILSEQTLADLEPELTETIQNLESSPVFQQFAERHGWTPRMMALGLMMRAAYEPEDTEI